MKKNSLATLRSLMLLAVLAMGASTALADRIYIEDFAVVPGQEYQMIVQYENVDKGEGNYSYNTQFDLTLPEGITLKSAGSGNRKRYFAYCTERTMPYAEGGLEYDEEFGDDPEFKTTIGINTLSSGAIRFANHNDNAMNGQIVGNDGPIVAVTIVVAADYDGTGVIKLTECQGSDPTGDLAYHYPDTECRVLLATESAKLAEATEGAQVGIAEAMTVAAKIPGQKSLILTDGNDNWLRVAAGDEVFNAISEYAVFKPGTLTGTLTGVSTNPLLTLAKKPVFYRTYDTNAFEAATPDEFVVAECGLEHYADFQPKPNQLIAISGYYFGGKLRGWGNNRGMSADLDLSWYEGTNTFTEGAPYYIKPVVATIKEAWGAAAGAPAKIAADDELYFQNYTLYPLNVPETPTAVNELNANKNVAGVKYVNVAGIESSEPFDGVNIVVTTYSDGTQKAVKVVK